MEADLTAEQAECVNRALAGHNFAILGEGGTGKSFVISEICRAKSWSVQVVCSTGIACDVFKELSACSELKQVTVHSFIGVGTGQAPFDVLVSRALNNPLVKRRLQEVDYLPRIHNVVVFIPLQIPAYKTFAHIPAFNSCKQCALVVFLEEDGPRLVKIFFIQVHHLSQLHLCSIWIHSGVLFEKP